MEITLDESDAGRSVQVAPGDTVVLRLGETPTSGYQWQFDVVDAAVLRAAGDDWAAEGAGLGAAGRRTFRFEVVGSGETMLTANLRRPWEGPAAATQGFSVTVTSEG